MAKRQKRRRYQRRPNRRVWVELTRRADLSPGDVAGMLARAGLAQANLEMEARAAHQASLDTPKPAEASGKEAGHA